MYQFTASKLKRVSQAYTINFPPATNCADTTCFSNNRNPTLQRHGKLWLYHLPEPRQITSRCRSANGWATETQTLSDAGVIRNATKCSITTNELKTIPELHGEIQSTIVNTHFYVPEQIQIVADHEIPLIKQVTPEEVTRLDEVKSKVMMPSQSFDVNSLFHIEQASARQFTEHTGTR